MATPNVALLKQTLEYVMTHPEVWDQSDWITPAEYREDPACGTAYCFAGHALTLTGCEVFDESEVAVDKLPEDVRNTIRDDCWMSEDNGVWVAEVSRAATALLGIEAFARFGPSRHLFAATNTLGDLVRMVTELCGELCGEASEATP
jgi:hypothetical protein